MRKLIVLLAILLAISFVFTASTVFAGSKPKPTEEKAAEGISGQLEIFSWSMAEKRLGLRDLLDNQVCHLHRCLLSSLPCNVFVAVFGFSHDV